MKLCRRPELLNDDSTCEYRDSGDCPGCEAFLAQTELVKSARAAGVPLHEIEAGLDAEENRERSS